MNPYDDEYHIVDPHHIDLTVHHPDAEDRSTLELLKNGTYKMVLGSEPAESFDKKLGDWEWKALEKEAILAAAALAGAVTRSPQLASELYSLLQGASSVHESESQTEIRLEGALEMVHALRVFRGDYIPPTPFHLVDPSQLQFDQATPTSLTPNDSDLVGTPLASNDVRDIDKGDDKASPGDLDRGNDGTEGSSDSEHSGTSDHPDTSSSHDSNDGHDSDEGGRTALGADRLAGLTFADHAAR